MKNKIEYWVEHIGNYELVYFNDKLNRLSLIDDNKNIILEAKFKTTKHLTFDYVTYYFDNLQVQEYFYNNNESQSKSLRICLDQFSTFIDSAQHGEKISYCTDGIAQKYEYFYKGQDITQHIKSTFSTDNNTEFEKFQLSVLYGTDFKFISEFNYTIEKHKSRIYNFIKDNECQTRKKRIKS